MKKMLSVHTFRDLLAGLIAAMAAFSYSYCTTPAEDSASRNAGVARRDVGGNLRFSNPVLLPGQDGQFPLGGSNVSGITGYDLGDAAVGSQVVRYLSGLGGVTPYTFTLNQAGSGTFSSLKVSPIGRVNATVTAASNATANFGAKLTDATGAASDGIFRLGIGGNAQPRFAMDRLPSGQVGQDYITNVEILGGDSTNTTFSVVPGSVVANGSAIGNLEFAGLTLFPDGALAGRPLLSGTVNFTARATRAGVQALNRAGTTPDQPFSITVSPLGIVQSVLATTKATIRGGGFAGLATVDLFALINSNGHASEFANNKMTVHFGGSVFTTTLDGRSGSKTGDLRVALALPTGLMHIQLRNVSVAQLLDPANTINRTNTTLVAQIEIGDLFLGTEAISFAVKSNRGKYTMQYALGKQRQLGGLFQVAQLTARDFSNGTAFKTTFVVAHAKGRTDTEFGNPQQATINIGHGFQESLPLRRGRGKSINIRTFAINLKSKVGTMTTGPLAQAQTGIGPGSAGTTATFLFGLDLITDTTNFSGDASRRIFPFSNR